MTTFRHLANTFVFQKVLLADRFDVLVSSILSALILELLL